MEGLPNGHHADAADMASQACRSSGRHHACAASCRCASASAPARQADLTQRFQPSQQHQAGNLPLNASLAAALLHGQDRLRPPAALALLSPACATLCPPPPPHCGLPKGAPLCSDRIASVLDTQDSMQPVSPAPQHLAEP